MVYDMAQESIQPLPSAHLYSAHSLLCVRLRRRHFTHERQELNIGFFFMSGWGA